MAIVRGSAVNRRRRSSRGVSNKMLDEGRLLKTPYNPVAIRAYRALAKRKSKELEEYRERFEKVNQSSEVKANL